MRLLHFIHIYSCNPVCYLSSTNERMHHYIYAGGGRAHKMKFIGYINEGKTGGTKVKRKLLQRSNSDKMLRTHRQLMAPLERLINSLDIRTEN